MGAWYDRLADTVPAWLATLKSPNGLYKHSASAYHEESLDATTLALDLEQMLSMLPSKSGVKFIKSCQNGTTGEVREPFYRELSAEGRLREMAHTYSGCQVAALFMAIDAHLQSEFKFYRQFLYPGAISHYMIHNMPWDTKPMGAGNMVDAAATMMRYNVRMQHKHAYWHVINEMYQWLDEHQRTWEHGFWGSEAEQGVSGVVQAGYHILRGLHWQDGRYYTDNHMESTVFEAMDHPSAPKDACHYMDCTVLAEHLSQLCPGCKIDREIAELAIEDLEEFHRDDGAFSFSPDGAIDNHNLYDVSPGNLESDIVGTVFCMQALRSALHVLGEEVPWGESATHGVRRG